MCSRIVTLATALAGALLVVSACGSRDEPRSSAPDVRASPTHLASASDEKVVNVYNWVDYIEPALLEKFTAETGIKVVYDTYDSNELLETKLMAGRTGYDVVVPSTGFIDRQIKAGAFQKLDRAKLSNWRNLDPDILKRVALHDPGNTYAINYMWGTAGIGYNERQVKAVMPDAPVDSWRLVFDPAIASKFKDCGIAVLDAPSDVSFVVLTYLGKDPNSESPEDLALAEQTLLAIRPYVRMIDAARYVEALATGEICIAVGWNGGVLQARDRAVEAGQGHVIKYSIPKEGTFMWFDMLAIPKDAPHPDNAHAFLNFLQRPDVAAANSNFIKYANGNAASVALIDEDVRTDPGIYPSAETRTRLVQDVVETDEFSRLLNRTWTRFVAGG
jgi:putrescine transport system substrate-binding protein